MKKILSSLFAVVLLLGVNKAYAQASQATKPVVQSTQSSLQQGSIALATRMTNSLETQLSLTHDQYKAVYDAYLGFYNKTNLQTPLTSEARDQYTAEKDAKIKGVLTAGQNTKYDARYMSHPSASQTDKK